MSSAVATASLAPASASTTHNSDPANDASTNSSSAPSDASSTSSYVPIREVASKVHDSLAHSNYTVLRLGTALADSLSSTALSFVPAPVKSTAASLSNPLIDAADTQLAHAFQRLQPVRAEVSKQVASLTSAFNRQRGEAQRYFMPAEWFTQVDEVMAASKAQLVKLKQSDLQPVLQTFYMSAAYQFLALTRRGQAGLQPFLDSLAAGMEKVWTETLEGPATAFYDAAMRAYKEAGSGARDLTSKSLLDRVKPLLGESYEAEVMHAYSAGNMSSSQLLYISSLQLFKQLQDRLKQKRLQADALQAEFLAAMKGKLGSSYNSGVEGKLTELIATWTEAASSKKKTIGDNLYDRYQYLLLSAQHVFDKVLPPVVSDEEEAESKQEESKQGDDGDDKDDAPNSLSDLASHVKDRIGERGVVSNVTTAGSNSVKESVNVASHVAKEGVALAGNVAQRAVQTASNVVRPVVEPVVARVQPIVQPIVQPYVDKAMPVVDGVKKELTARQQQLSDALQQSLQLTKSRVESVQQYLTAVTKQTGEKVLAVANDTKTQLTASATSAASSLHSSLPPALRTRLEELQQRLVAAVQYASQLRQDGQLQQQLLDLSRSYADVARTVVADQLHAIGGNLNTDKLAQLVEEAKASVSQLILNTKKQLALEQGRDEADVDDSTSPSANDHASSGSSEHKTDEVKEGH